MTPLDWLRADGLTGGKEVCAEGECGACAVLVARPDGPTARSWVAINACLVPAAAFDQQEVVTAEGLGRPGQLHPVQREMADRGGSQCGYCTPGFICSMAAESTGRARPALRAGSARARRRRPADRARSERIRPARAVRQPVPVRRLRPIRDAAYALGQPEAADPLQARTAEPAPRPPAPTPRARRATMCGRPGLTGRPSSCSPPARTGGWWPGSPTGGSSSTSALTGRADHRH